MTWRPLPVSNAEQLPVPFRRSLEALADKIGAPTPAALQTIFDNWEKVVGPSIAAHAQPQAVVDGVLSVLVDDARWATELKWLTNGLVDKLNEEIGRSSASDNVPKLRGITVAREPKPHK